MKNPMKIIRWGLSLVFLANGLTAFFAPQEFRELLEASFVSHWLPLSVSAFLIIIGINDLLLALLILFNKYQKYILVWAMLWLIGVMIVTQDIIGVLEHLGFFSMALALWVSAYTNFAAQK